jgi:selenocysteine lyase/cysteine desulfurase
MQNPSCQIAELPDERPRKKRIARMHFQTAPHFPIYMDYSATTPIDPRVADKMIPYLREQFGNPASRSHMYGWTAEKAVEEARGHVAALVNADPREIIWTSGATESTTWPSRARSSTRPRASTSSPSRPSTRRCWTRCANWNAGL